MMSQPYTDDLARVRAEFEHWRSQASGRGRIPDRLWRLALDLLDRVPTSVVCRELRLSNGDLKKRRQSLAPAATSVRASKPAFVELRAVDLVSPDRPRVSTAPSDNVVGLTFTRTDGVSLDLRIPSSQWPRIEALCASFLAR